MFTSTQAWTRRISAIGARHADGHSWPFRGGQSRPNTQKSNTSEFCISPRGGNRSGQLEGFDDGVAMGGRRHQVTRHYVGRRKDDDSLSSVLALMLNSDGIHAYSRQMGQTYSSLVLPGRALSSLEDTKGPQTCQDVRHGSSSGGRVHPHLVRNARYERASAEWLNDLWWRWRGSSEAAT